MPDAGPSLTWFVVILAACQDKTAPAKAQPRFSGAPITIAFPAWQGQAVSVNNTSGALVVSGAPVTTITATATPFALADNQADADAALADVAITFAFSQQPQPSTVFVDCGQAGQDHGSALAVNTGCDPVTVTVPSGSIASPVIVTARTKAGDLTVQGITENTNPSGTLSTAGGNAYVTLAGSADVEADGGSLAASVQPTPGAFVIVTNHSGDVTLSLPADFAADTIELRAVGGTVTVAPGFTNGVTTSGGPVGKQGTGAKVIDAYSEGTGNVTLTPL